ncbi:uncharacterized protein LOC124257507 [Haliotis rubra]|uniref:uncharacterized protein LOC124257507 n=1 Tax=Haliotis rubra TaxID=36100 RepID=UPI001EE59AA5|nr:uncharacterized protein LOC124257507 [Haliotis rubra]
MDMSDRYWTLWTVVLYICMANVPRGAEATCTNTYEFRVSTGFYKDMKIDSTIRQRGNKSSLVDCLFFCSRVIVNNFFYNKNTNDCICALAYPGSALLVSGPGYNHYGAAGLIGGYLMQAMNASSAGYGFVSGGVFTGWSPQPDDEAPWLEVGLGKFLYFSEVRISSTQTAAMTDVWFRDSGGNWIHTWTKNDKESVDGSFLFPHCRMLTVRTDAVRIATKKGLTVQIYNIHVYGRM